jgi:peptidyl-prolyl cis-trans isomerase D
MIAVVFVFYFGYSFRSNTGLKIAYVNGEVISGLEYQKIYRGMLEGLQTEYKHVWSDNLIKVFDIKNRALDSLIEQKLISQEAKRLGLDVTDEEIQEEIMSFPAFQFRGQFDPSRYQSLLQQNRMKPEDFEAGIARQLLRNKIEQLLVTFGLVTDQEARDQYTYANEKLKISLVRFSPEDFEGAVSVDEAGLTAYFQEHKEEYRVPEKIKVVYITLDPEAFKDQVELADDEVIAHYEDNLESFQEEKQVKVSDVFLRVETDASEEAEQAVKERALEIAKKAQEETDFAGLVEEYSEAPPQEERDDLGWFSPGQLDTALEEAAFKMEVDEVSEPIKTRDGYHIIKVEAIKEARTKDLAEVRAQIEDALVNMESLGQANEKGLSLIDQMPYDVDLRAYAAEHELSVEESGYFSRTELIPGIGGDQKLKESLFSLDKGDVSELIEYDGKFYLIQMAEKVPPTIPELDEVREAAERAYTSYLATEAALAEAKGYLGKLKDGAGWDDLAVETGLTTETTDFFTRRDSIPQIGYDPAIMEAVFALSEGTRYPDKVIESRGGLFVVRWEGEEGIDEEGFEEEKEKYRSRISRMKFESRYGDWLASLRETAEIEFVTPIDTL